MSELRWYIDRCDAALIAGWFDENGPVAEVDIEINGRWACTVAPTSFRQDLKEAGIGDGRRSFEFPLAGRLQQDANRIVVIRKGTVLYENSIFLPPPIEDGGQLQRRLGELIAETQSLQAQLSKSWYGREILEAGRAALQREEPFRRAVVGDAELSNALARLETATATHVGKNEFDVALRLIQDQAEKIWWRTLERGWISGSDRLDRLCVSIGREVRGVADRRRSVPLAGRPRYVYVVSQLNRLGGHTRLLEDMIAAQPHADHQIIWTWSERADLIANIAEVLRVREAVPLQVLRGEPVERLRAAFAFLTQICPDVLVHLGHPYDPITIALMQPGIALRCLMIHHADCSFALGRSLGGIIHVALGRHFQDFVRREWALETVLLPLTCGEPVVAKTAAWTRERPFLTATSGAGHKFDLNGGLSYLDVLTQRFAAREGSHVHIGPLSGEQMLRIEQHLEKLSFRERFVHIEHVPHLASTLCELAPSVYIDSYPIGGGRAIVEAMAAGLPICAASHDPNLDSSTFCYPERLWWTHPAQVGSILAGLDPTTVERHAALSRKYFEQNHSPATFKRRLQTLVNLKQKDNAARRSLSRSDTPKLSVIVIGHNMARELPRTIRSLSPTMQRDIDPGDYEVILIDNGSTQTCDENELRRLLPGLVMHWIQNATVSPVPAINFGLTVARGDLVGVCIDGARMVSPGLLSKTLAASRLHRRPVIGTIAFHLGPDVQRESVKHGYNQAMEDELLARSGWEADGYRLFTISAFAGSSAGGWLELPAESSAFFLRAEHWRALGGWDEGFVTPGGGLVNLDTWARACADPTGELIMLLGEATFHQVHGGIATNNLNPPWELFHEEYERLRGRPYERPTRQPLYFGTLPETMRTSLKFSLGRL